MENVTVKIFHSSFLDRETCLTLLEDLNSVGHYMGKQRPYNEFEHKTFSVLVWSGYINQTPSQEEYERLRSVSEVYNVIRVEYTISFKGLWMLYLLKMNVIESITV